MTAIRNNRARKAGFTLIEILIVVIILGILAAIVIPQFSSASNDARKSNVQTTAQTLRSQVALYRLQHQDTLPDIATFWDKMTRYSNAAGATQATKDEATGFVYGPYMQQIPTNSLNGLNTVGPTIGDADPVADCGWAYDYQGGIGSGQVWGTNLDRRARVLP